MRRREILVFIAAFVVVLLGGAALAEIGSFAGGANNQAPAAMSVTDNAQVEPAATSAIDMPGSDLQIASRSDSPAADDAAPTTDKPPADPPRDEQPAADSVEKDDPPADSPKEDDLPVAVDETPPPLEILFPENEQRFDEERIAFEGTTEPGAKVFAGRYEADVDEEGNWRIVLILSPGGNLVALTATDHAGNVAEASVRVYLDRKQEPEYEFSAHQKWEVVDGHPAANLYYGTARPSARIWVGSRYGSGETVANSEGHWELRVTFPVAPCNEAFPVVVESGDHRREFRVKYVCASHEFTAHQKYGENTEPWTKFYGTGVPGSVVWVGSEFGSTETRVAENGEWLAKLHFNDQLPPNHEIRVVVEGEGGRAEFGFFWIVETTDHVAFTANQKYGSCGEAIPYDKFWGTASPGATIWVEAPYGGGVTTAGDGGNWEIRVEFREAPVGEHFTVVIESSDGGRSTFDFVRTGESDH